MRVTKTHRHKDLNREGGEGGGEGEEGGEEEDEGGGEEEE